MGQTLSLAIFVGTPLIQGAVSSFFMSHDIKTWYKKLKKPKWNPPNQVFGPVWSALYTMMGVASWIIWKKGSPSNILPLSLYGSHLLFNFLWSPLFFKCHRPDIAFADIIVMDTLAIASTVAFFNLDLFAGGLMCPYIAWGIFAACLNYRIWKDNPKAHEISEDKESEVGKRQIRDEPEESESISVKKKET